MVDLASVAAGKSTVAHNLQVAMRRGDIVVLPSVIPADITLSPLAGPSSFSGTPAGRATVSMSMGSQQAVFSTSAGRATVIQSLGVGVHVTNTPSAGTAGVSNNLLVIKQNDYFVVYVSNPPFSPSDVLMATRTGPPALTPFAGASQGSATTTGSLSADNALAGASSGSGTVIHSQPVPIDGASTATATVAADLTRHILAGSTSGISAVTADIVLSLALNGATVGIATTNGNLAKIQDLAATPVGTGSVVGNLTYIRLTSGDISCLSSVVGDLSRHILAGSPTGFGTVSTNLGGSFTYEVYSVGTSAVSGVVGLAFSFATTLATSGSVTGNLTFPRDLSTGTSNGESTVVGNALLYILSGQQCSGSASVTGHLRYLADIVRLAATSSGSSTVIGLDRLKFRFGNQSIVGTSTVTAQVRRMWPLAASSDGTSSVIFDHLTVHTIPPGPVVCFATVVGETIMDSKFGGTSSGIASLIINTYARYNLSTGTSNGVSDNHGRLGVHPQDFEVGPCDGSAAVHGQIRLSVLFLSGTSRGGRIPFLDGTGHETGFNDTLATARLGIAFAFPGPMRAVGTSEVEAILLLNDSGLIRGNSRIDASLARLSTEYSGIVTAFAKTLYAYLDRPGDLRADVNDAYAGVGRWYPGGTFDVQLYFYETDQMAPYRNEAPTFDTGTSHRGDRFFIQHTNTERRNAHKWDGTYAPFTRAAAPNLSDNPWYVDPDQSGIFPGNPRYLSGAATLPGALRRRYQLADPGELGGWFVDTVPFNYRDVAMRAASTGEARFSEPQSTVDMDLELKSSMKGQIHGAAIVQALALLLSFRHIMATGNVTALRYLLKMCEGNVTKSQDTRLPITRKNSELIQPVHQTHALFV